MRTAENAGSVQVYAPIAAGPTMVPQASTDAQLVALWLHGRPVTTRRAYERDAAAFSAFVDKPLGAVTLGDVQAYTDNVADLAPATRARRLNVVKSLISFAQRLGYIPFNVAAAVKAPAQQNTRAERILPEADVQRMLALEPDARNRVLLRLLYAAGLRASEIVGLAWRDVQPRDDAGQVTVLGKGDKTRAVLLTAATWRELVPLRGVAGLDDPVFLSRKSRGHLSTVQVWRIVRAAAIRAGIDVPVSTHWLRHAHASHALDRGAPIHLVQQTLGHASVATTGTYLHARPMDSSSRYLPV